MEHQKTTAVLLSSKDRADYQCRKCGQCCRHIENSVMVESLDAYRLAKYLRGRDPNICTIDEVLARYCEPMPLTRDCFPIFMLKTIGPDLLTYLIQWCTEHNYIGASAAELRKEALQLHIDRIFDNPQWGGYLPFNKRYRPEVWRAAHIVYVRNECCRKISPVTQEQIDHVYNGTIPCAHCGRWSEFIVLGTRLRPEPLVPCLSCDCHDPDMGCTMPSIDKSYACPLVSCDDEEMEVLDG